MRLLWLGQLEITLTQHVMSVPWHEGYDRSDNCNSGAIKTRFTYSESSECSVP